ncbi:MAG: bifunctional (p)ppGpp synthetase/guanosine-3',5'-bis(diphosphate) 3'-pyrophosphohydrolase [Ruminococcaceae bacterium]|nr:bifunctional (p)ppGpp synthetase/guanosine-3',5'-bis(diphosphate) 3'-pyrophosphohydrolase [Oscillospiraceae bacterium]
MGNFDLEARYQELENKIKANNATVDLNKIRVAFECARDLHGLQARKDGTPYITHPIAAAEIIAEMGMDEDTLVAALLHDCIEDTKATHEDIAKKFGNRVAELVEGVTKLDKVVYTSKEEEQMENLRKMLMAMAKDIRVIIIKIADRLHNMRTMQFQTEAKQREKSLETMEIYAPIAHRLGMQKIKWELEDISLLYLDPIGYEEIQSEIDKCGKSYEDFMDATTLHIKNRLDEVGVKATVYGRMKHIYSIYRKMYGQNKLFSEVLDLCAFRVIVDNIAECYHVLGYIHEMFKPLPGRFKDYIRTPKPNMYQSLHTTVIGSEGIPFEVQIRTWDMHHTAEFGIAAHWKYKGGIQGHQDSEEKFAWVRQLLEAQQDADAQDFFHTLKIDMFADEVFVFTPRGDVVNLPAGSTPIDFAYSIHSAVGNRMTGATVNGKIVPFGHVLENGDIVEIITSKSAKGPTRDWLSMVKSGEARNKIRQWFKKERREENIMHGRSSLEAELKRLGVSMNVVTDETVIPAILKRFSFQSFDELCAAIGYGGISSHKAANKIRDEINRMKSSHKISEDGAFITAKSTVKDQKAVHGIVVEGLDNFLVKFARCCTPVPGDPVRGFITRGNGVSVHRQDCVNCQKALADPEEASRWVNVSWGNTADERYQTSIIIIASDRGGLVMDIATALNLLKMKLVGINARDIGNDMGKVHITLEVKSRDEVMTAISKLSGISGVKEIIRSGD